MATTQQFSTFYLADRLYGIPVMRVQEVTRALSMTRVPLAPAYVHGLINLRGQIATAIGLRDLFATKDVAPEEHMNVVCNINGHLFSLLVDKIGDVMEVDEAEFERAPDTVPVSIKKFMSGVYKVKGDLLSIINVDQISEEIQNKKV